MSGPMPLFTEEQAREMERLYLDGMTGVELAKRFRCGRSTVHNYLNARGVKQRGAHPRRRYHADHHFFDEIDTEEKAYWLGFFVADGCVVHAPRVWKLQLVLSERDRAHVEAFRDALRSDHRIVVREDKGFKCAHLVINSPEMVRALRSHNVHPRKSLTQEPVAGVPDELLPHLFRGYLDGDGCVCLRWRNTAFIPIVRIIGTSSWLSWMSQCMEKWVGSQATVTRHSGTRAFAISYHGRHIAEKALRPLYEDATVCLPRKREKYLEIVRLNDELGR